MDKKELLFWNRVVSGLLRQQVATDPVAKQVVTAIASALQHAIVQELELEAPTGSQK